MATNSPNLISLPSARPETGVFYPANDSQIASAISRAQENLLSQQKPDGHWCGELYVDSTLCADYVLYLHWLGEVDRELQERCTQHILRRQLPDGGWNIYYGGPSEINASVKAYFALKLAGYSADLPFMREARANVLRLGGVPRVNTFSKLYLAQFIPSRRRRTQDAASNSVETISPACARGSRALDDGAHRRWQRWLGHGLSGNAQCARCPARPRLSEQPSGLGKGAKGFRRIVRQRCGRFPDSALPFAGLGHRH